MTAFYMFRLIFVAFFGKKRSNYHAHESGWVMTLPLIILAVLSVVAGFVNSGWFYNTFGQSFSTFIFFGEAEVPHVNMACSRYIYYCSTWRAYLQHGLFTLKRLVNTRKLAIKIQWTYISFFIINFTLIIFTLGYLTV